jgi:hypothetical protein
MDNKNVQTCITLSESLNTKEFGVDNQVHQKQFEQVTAEINKFITDAANNAKTSTYERRQNTISILGGRGSGKSSFVHSIRRYYEMNGEISILPVIDPTLIEQKGHIFLVIIAQIKKLVEEHLNMKDCNPDSMDMCIGKDWRAKLEKLSRGLPTINDVGHLREESWEDSNYIMDQGLSSVQSAFELEEHFRKLVEQSLEILGKKAFLLVLDDIDLDFPKGWMVLETLRKYITTPQIITLLSGDMELFDKAIRKIQWKNFGKALLKNEGEQLNRMEKYDNLVTQLSEQYLLKVMQPAHRYVLDTLWEKYQRKLSVSIRYAQTEEKKDAITYYENVLKNYGIKESQEAKCYYVYLMNLPLRTQIQLLYALKGNEGSLDVIYSPFIGELSLQRIDIHTAISNPALFNIEVLKFLFYRNLLENSYQLEPSRTEGSYNACLTVFSLLFGKLLPNNPFLIFDYFIKIGYVSQLATYLVYDDKDNDKYSIQGLCRHSAIYQDIVLRNATALMAAYLKDAMGKNQVGDRYCGVINLPGLKKSARSQEREDISIESSIDAIFAGRNIEDPEQKALLIQKKTIGYMPLSIALQRNNETKVQYSFFTLLGVIGELLKLDDIEEIKKALPALSLLRSYPTPKNLMSKMLSPNNDDEEDGYIYEENEEESPNEYNSNLATQVLNWKNKNSGIVIPPYLLGKIFTRFFYALQEIEHKKFDNLGDAMHRRIIAFFHAVLLEEAKENGMAKDLNYNNPVKSDKVFIENLQKMEPDIIGQFDNLSFSKWIMSCPLLLSFINTKDTIIRRYLLSSNVQLLFEQYDLDYFDLYTPLTAVLLAVSTGGNQTLPKPRFTGAGWRFINTIRVLHEADKNSYQVLKNENIHVIRNAYGHLFSNAINTHSKDVLLTYAEDERYKNDPTVSAWLNRE